MTTTVNVHEAKTRLSELLALVESGERVVIARAGTPVAQLLAVDPPGGREFGSMAFDIPAEFWHDLSDSELAAWE